MVAVSPALALFWPSSPGTSLALCARPAGPSRPGVDSGPGAFSRALQASLSGPAGHLPVPRSSAGARPGRYPDELDAAARQVANLGPPGASLGEPLQPPPPTRASTAPAGTPGPFMPTSLEEILPALVRKIAWSGDARRGAVRIELGAGALSGATLLVMTDGGRVRIALSAQGGAPLEPWRERIVARLASRGIEAEVT